MLIHSKKVNKMFELTIKTYHEFWLGFIVGAAWVAAAVICLAISLGH